MPEYLRALVVILFLAVVVFAFAKMPACALATRSADYSRRRNLWFAVTLAAFLAHNYWVFAFVTAALLLLTRGKERNGPASFFILLFAVPAYPNDIPGFGIVNYFFTLDYVRLLIFALLLPAFWGLIQRSDVERFGQSAPDKLLTGYLVLRLVLLFDAPMGITEVLRYGVFYPFVDVFLPYYVMSRAIRNNEMFRDAVMAFVLACLVLSAIATVEFLKQWLLYHPLEAALHTDWGYGNYLTRDTNLRALATTGQPVVLGYVIAVGLGFALYLSHAVPSRPAWITGLVVLGSGLIASVSRGPWVGTAAIVLVFIAMGPAPILGFAKLGIAAIAAAPILLLTSVGAKIIDLMPFIGTIEERNVTYRELFTRISIQFIKEHPFFGAYDFANSPMMQVLKPQGLLDTLNTFLAVGLASGLVGMTLFAGIFFAVATGIYKGMKRHARTQDDAYRLGRALFATLLGIIVILCTTSSITVIPVTYWSVLGLGVAYMRIASAAEKAGHRDAATMPVIDSPRFNKARDRRLNGMHGG